jgi:hypothetical protein
VNPIQFHAVFSVLTASSAMSRFPVVVQLEFGRRSGWQNDCDQKPPLREHGRFQAEVCAAVQPIIAADGICFRSLASLATVWDAALGKRLASR